MTNTSASGGYLSPTVISPPAEGNDLADQVQAVVVGITGLDPTLVRPRWQPIPPKQPEATADWCAIGVTSVTPDARAAIIHHGDGDGSDEMQRHEDIEILASFYGPNAETYAAILRDGLQISQNREAMYAEGLALVSTGRAVNASIFVNQQWVYRIDLPVSLRRMVDRTYPVLNILSSAGSIKRDGPGSTAAQTTPWDVEPPQGS